MPPDGERYCIKPDYRPNLAAAGASTAATDYWTPERLRLSTRYQYDVYHAAAALMREPRVSSVLDVGSGPPVKLKALLPSKPLAVQLVDQAESAPLAEKFLPEARFKPVDLETVDLDLGQRFDLAICADVIEHLRDPDPCLRFIHRHLAADGKLLISTPERDILRGRACRTSPHADHVREWNREEFARFLASRGWRVVRHEILPAQRTSTPLRFVGRMLDRLGLAPEWYSCQMALCQPA